MNLLAKIPHNTHQPITNYVKMIASKHTSEFTKFIFEYPVNYQYVQISNIHLKLIINNSKIDHYVKSFMKKNNYLDKLIDQIQSGNQIINGSFLKIYSDLKINYYRKRIQKLYFEIPIINISNTMPNESIDLIVTHNNINNFLVQAVSTELSNLYLFSKLPLEIIYKIIRYLQTENCGYNMKILYTQTVHFDQLENNCYKDMPKTINIVNKCAKRNSGDNLVVFDIYDQTNIFNYTKMIIKTMNKISAINFMINNKTVHSINLKLYEFFQNKIRVDTGLYIFDIKNMVSIETSKKKAEAKLNAKLIPKLADRNYYDLMSERIQEHQNYINGLPIFKIDNKKYFDFNLEIIFFDDDNDYTDVYLF